ncbi:MAG: hypothetical protein D3923_01040 [Candidatus Electrothrix sp. AR3]|nr:hypothetical protein [Candidatus Electrothrix sp. AR3]
MAWLAVILVLLSAAVHASWNLLAHSQQVNGTLFFRLHLFTGLFGILPVLIAEWKGIPFSVTIWKLLVLSGLFQAIYFLGLTGGYRNGNFSVVYPVARSLPIVILAIFDVIRGNTLSVLGWFGIFMVITGCILAPLESFRKITLSTYWNRVSIWVLMIIFGVTGYSVTDKIAAESLPQSAETAARYGIWEAIFTIPFLYFVFRLTDEPILIYKKSKLADWKWVTIFSILIFCSYWLMLWAYQISPYVSYVAGLRQFSIVIGVVLAVLFFREPAPILRISAAVIITIGVICISQASVS